MWNGNDHSAPLIVETVDNETCGTGMIIRHRYSGKNEAFDER